MGGSSTPRHTCASSTSTCTSEALEAVSEHYRAEPSPIRTLYPPRPRPCRIHPCRHPCARPGRRHRRAPARNRRIRRAHPRHHQLPERYLAHHYLRYLGDLSGGQAVAALVTRHYGIPAEALSMYRFTELPKPKVFKDDYRELLDNAPLTDERREPSSKNASKASASRFPVRAAGPQGRRGINLNA